MMCSKMVITWDESLGGWGWTVSPLTPLGGFLRFIAARRSLNYCICTYILLLFLYFDTTSFMSVYLTVRNSSSSFWRSLGNKYWSWEIWCLENTMILILIPLTSWKKRNGEVFTHPLTHSVPHRKAHHDRMEAVSSSLNAQLIKSLCIKRFPSFMSRNRHFWEHDGKISHQPLRTKRIILQCC